MTPPPDDLRLMRQYASTRSPQALAMLVERHREQVLAQSRQLMGSHAAAQDVTQETFLRLMQTDHPPSQSVTGWLRKVSRQVALDTLRSNAARQRREKQYALSVMDRFTSQDIGPLIDQAIAELPGHARQLVHEHYLNHRTLRQMASERNISPATMMRQVHAAAELLRDGLKRKGILVPAALAGSLLLTHAAMASAHQSLATAASVVLAMKITTAIAMPVLAGAIASQVNGSQLSQQPLLPAPSPVIQTQYWQQAELALDRLVYAQSGWVYVAGGITLDEKAILLYRPLEHLDQSSTQVMTGQFDLLTLPADQLRDHLRRQTGQPVELLVRPNDRR